MAEVFSLAKWRLFLTVLPFTALFCLAKFAMHRLGWEPWAFDSLMLLIRDLDNPFQYDGRSSVDIDLSLVEATFAHVKAAALQRPAA